MKFFSKETCQKLQEFGCKTDEEYSFYPDEELPHRKRWHSDEVDAFTIADFLSDEPYALENCKKFKPQTAVCRACGDDSDTPSCSLNLSQHAFPISGAHWFRHALLDSPDQEAFILEALNGNSL